ncbi:MAG: hypothetical protein GY854_28675 [Deltaproteobacteria bacterium]|nr:hypothetical protein [Deltaproteobacteria bacterium]
MPKAHSPNPQEQPANIYQQFFPQIDTPDPSSYLEWSGVRQMTIVLGVICIAAVIRYLSSHFSRVTSLEKAKRSAGLRLAKG